MSNKHPAGPWFQAQRLQRGCTMLLLGSLLLASGAARAQLRIDITSGVSDPVPLALIPIVGLSTTIAGIAAADLTRTGRFRVLATDALPAQPNSSGGLQQALWRQAGADYVVLGRDASATVGLAADIEIVNMLTNQRLTAGAGQRVTATTPRRLAHLIADLVYEKVLGVRGAFATRLAYVSVDGRPPSRRYQLIVADADGAEPRVVLDSREPIMSPAWSPDGEWLAYVSFEGRVSGVYVQRLRTGERRRVSARVGINGAPAWSPDGKRLALTLSGSGGNPDIYLLDLTTQKLSRLTNDPGIDTEADWSADGKQIYFTSDRGGGPQIYRITLGSGAAPQRVTFTGRYNARPSLAPDGKSLAMVTLDTGGYRIAIQDLASGAARLLSRGPNDESPSFAPNSAALIFAGRERGTGTLTVISTDGLASQRLHADQGEVREPVWGPY